VGHALFLSTLCKGWSLKGKIFEVKRIPEVMICCETLYYEILNNFTWRYISVVENSFFKFSSCVEFNTVHLSCM
jgi:hypothetical protein